MKKNIKQNGFTQLVDFYLEKIRDIFSPIHQELSSRRKFTVGFTLVETLVAISILMISVTGPLYYASESLKAAVYARDQITAFYLAQDAFEQIRKIRDDNIYGSADYWYLGLNGCENLCRVNANGLFYNIDTATPITNENKYLYMNNADGKYSHNVTNSTKTIFQRTVKIERNDGTNWDDSTEMKVTVMMDWNSRGVARNFTAYEFLRRLNK